jgi:hypothetical protein
MPGIVLPNGSTNGGAGRLLRPIMGAVGAATFVRPGWEGNVEASTAPVSGVGAGPLIFAAIYNPETITYNGIACKVSATPIAQNVRLGLYNCDTSEGVFTPTSLVVDAGTVSCATTGDKVAAASFELTEGWYMTAFVADTLTSQFSALGRNANWLAMADRTFGSFGVANGSLRPLCLKSGQGAYVAAGLPANAPSGLLYGLDIDYHYVMLRLPATA